MAARTLTFAFHWTEHKLGKNDAAAKRLAGLKGGGWSQNGSWKALMKGAIVKYLPYSKRKPRFRCYSCPKMNSKQVVAHILV